MHNVAGVRITVVRAKEGLVDDSNVLVGAGASEIGGMVKGKGTTGGSADGFMQIPRTVCLKRMPPSIHLFSFPLIYFRSRWRGFTLHNAVTDQHSSVLHDCIRYTMHTLFVLPAPTPYARERNYTSTQPFPSSHKPNTLDRDGICRSRPTEQLGNWGRIAILRDGFDEKTWGKA